jgi:hypothetical protein
MRSLRTAQAAARRRQEGGLSSKGAWALRTAALGYRRVAGVESDTRAGTFGALTPDTPDAEVARSHVGWVENLAGCRLTISSFAVLSRRAQLAPLTIG